MAYNNVTTRDNARVLIPEQKIVDGIISGMIQGSAILPLMTRLPNMTTGQAKMPVMESLPMAYWVNGDTGLKQTTNAAWKNKFINAEELAVVVPIPDNVFDDAEYDLWGEYRPRIQEVMYKKVDEAIILGKGRPLSWRAGLISSIINVGADVAPSTNSLYKQVSDAMAKVELSGYNPNGILGGVAMKQGFREGFLDTQGNPLAVSEVTALPRNFADNGAWDSTLAKFIVGDFKQAVYAIRKDIEFKVFDSGVITDNSGNIIYNLLQQDMKALRVTFRMGWEIPNPVNSLAGDESVRFPFALVQPANAPTTYNVTFTVTDTSSAVVEGATVVFGEQVKKSNSSGQAVFKSLGNESVEWLVSKAGCKTQTGTQAVATSAVSVNVTNFA